jgi:hypothetical protein
LNCDKVEKGETFYEVETLRANKTRDLLFDKGGRLVSVEEALPLESAPAEVRDAPTSQGRVSRVERVTKGERVFCEGVVEKNGKRREVVVGADGKPVTP